MEIVQQLTKGNYQQYFNFHKARRFKYNSLNGCSPQAQIFNHFTIEMMKGKI